MKKNSLRQMLVALTLAATATAGAQSVFRMPELGGATGDPTRKATAAATTADAAQADPMTAEADRVALQQYMDANGGRRPVAKAPLRAPWAADDDTFYRFRGQNNFAGRADENDQTGFCGLVGFNLFNEQGQWAWKCDTLVSNDDISPYSVPTESYFYSYRPQQGTGGITGAEITKFSKQTMQQVGEKWTIKCDGQSGIPYRGLCYDAKNRQVYAISMGNTVNNVQPYYLNIVDTISGQLRRVGEICHYNGNDQFDNVNPGELFCIDGQLYALLRNGGRQSLWVARVNPLDASYEYIGDVEGTKSGVYGQPMTWDAEAGVFYLNYYDFEQGTVYFSIRPEDLLNPVDGLVKTTRLGNAPTGFNWFYITPEALPAGGRQLQAVSDLSLTTDDEGLLLTLRLTTPAQYVDGTTPTGELAVKLFIDNVETELFDLPEHVGYGQQLEMMADVTPGLHTVRLELQPEAEGSETLLCTQLLVCGKDVPAAPTNLKVSVNSQNIATITWNAPTTGRYQDFGGQYEASALTYRVVRNPDGKLVSEGGTSRRVQDKELPEHLAYYSYTVQAVMADGRLGAAATTDQFTAGTYMAMPYENDLDTYNQILGWSVINANNDGTMATWQWNPYSHNFYGKNGSNTGRNDDWLISPPFRMQKGKVYEFRAKLSGQSNLDFWLGTSQSVDGMKKLINALDPDHLMTNEHYSVFFTPDEDGTYYIGLHDYVFGQYTWYVDDVYVGEFSTDAAPAQPADVVYTAADKGALSATVTLTAPSTTIAGEALTSLSSVKVFTTPEGKLLGEATDVKPGQPLSINVPAEQGFNYVRVVAENAEGQGWPATVRAFAGQDVPVMDRVRMLWSEDDEGSVTLTYNIKPVGQNGGYVDPSQVKYTVYQHFDQWPVYRPVASELTETEVEVAMIDPTRTGQAQYILAVSATSIQGESELKPVGVVLGKPFTLPYVEPLDKTGLRHEPYITKPSQDQHVAWNIDAEIYNTTVTAQNNDGYSLILLNDGTADGQASFITPIIDFTKSTQPMFRLWVYDMPGAKKGGYVTIDALTNGADQVAASDTVQLGLGCGWREVAFALQGVAGKRAQIALTAYMPDPAARIWADNWTISEATGNDLALTAISKPYAPKNGQQTEVSVAVTNMGTTDATDYSVLFNLNGEIVAEAEATEALKPGQTAELTFPLNVSSVYDELIYSAELLYDDDNQDNNLSAEVELTPEQIELPAPSDLTLNSQLSTLNWLAPAQTDGRQVVLDFEDQPAFSNAAEIEGWLNIDADKMPTTYFVAYYGNYWPLAGQPLGFMTWSAAESGNPNAAMWKQHQGEKCLIHFGHMDVSPDGYPVTADDDWFISPEIKGGSELSFWTLTNDLQGRLEIRYSTTDREPASFTQLIQTVSFTTTQAWQQVKLNVPQNAKYVALHVPYDGFGIMIDELSYTAAQAPVLQGYNIYNGSYVAATTAETTANVEQNGNYRVTAVYDLGESVPTEAVPYANGVESVALSTQQTGQVYDLQGRRLEGARRGLNIVRQADGKAVKIVVK